MSTELKTAVVNEALGLSNLFAQTCALKHGIPEKPVKQQVGALPDEPQPQVFVLKQEPAATPATDTPSPGATAAAAVKDSFLRRAAPWLLTTAMAAGGAGAGLGYLLPNKPATTTSATQQPTDKDGSLLQYLEDRGNHLRDGAWPTTKQ